MPSLTTTRVNDDDSANTKETDRHINDASLNTSPMHVEVTRDRPTPNTTVQRRVSVAVALPWTAVAMAVADTTSRLDPTTVVPTANGTGPPRFVT